MIKILIFELFLLIGCLSEFDPKCHRNWNLLPHDICGQAQSNRIVGGVEAPMNAYPWLARIGYGLQYSKTIFFLCGGSVANTKTVLTAAHCVLNLPEGLKVLIRLGEHNTDTNPDCEGDFCADPVLDIAPSEILIPKYYNSESFEHDIALIRLGKEIKFTAFIKPICFGNKEFIKKDFTGSMTEAAGWGIYDIDEEKSSTKLQSVKLRIVKHSECSKYFPASFKIKPTQTCAGGVVGKDTCNGDSGGPLMKVDDGSNGPRYYLLGIVSFGSKDCGKTSMPGVYTNMSAYMKWFLDNLNGISKSSMKVK